MKNLLFIFLIALGIITMSFFQEQQKGAPWNIPAKYKSMKSTNVDENLTKTVGKMLWSKHCKSCHGNLGLGDGVKSASLKTFPGNFKDPAFQSQSDGVIYYQSIIGRDEMPSFEAKIPDEEDRWLLVNYIRSLK